MQTADDSTPQQIDISVADEDPATEPPALNVFGQIVDRLVTISYTSTSLIMCMGRFGDDESSHVLVPFAEVKFASSDRDDGSAAVPLFSQLLTLDNAAYLIADLSSDFRSICQQLQKVSTGEVSSDAVRLEHTKRFLSDAKNSIEGCLEELNKIKRS